MHPKKIRLFGSNFYTETTSASHQQVVKENFYILVTPPVHISLLGIQQKVIS